MQMSTNTIQFLYIVHEVQWRGKKLTTLQLFSNNDASDENVRKCSLKNILITIHVNKNVLNIHSSVD